MKCLFIWDMNLLATLRKSMKRIFINKKIGKQTKGIGSIDLYIVLLIVKLQEKSKESRMRMQFSGGGMQRSALRRLP